MYINTGKSNRSSGNILECGNVDYCKRYILIEIPQSMMFECDITIMNISSFTDRDSLGFMKDLQKLQNTNVYHCKGMVFSKFPETNTWEETKKLINLDSMITVDDVSYGIHNYDLRKTKFGELETSTSYDDLFSSPSRYSALPNVRFYNRTHHVINEDISGNEYSIGKMYLPKVDKDTVKYVELVPFRDMIDSYTTIIVTKASNYSNYNAYDEDYAHGVFETEHSTAEMIEYLDLNNLSMLIVGPVTDFILGLLVNSANFVYDSVDGISRVQYKTDHVFPTNNIYMQQIHDNQLSTFLSAMEYIRESVGWRFRLMVKSTISSVTVSVLKYDVHNGGFITKDFNFEIGNFRNDQHYHASHWVNNIGM